VKACDKQLVRSDKPINGGALLNEAEQQSALLDLF